MITSAAIYHVLHFFHITIDIRNVCVFLAPLFSSFTTIVTYHLTKELKVWGGPSQFYSFEAYPCMQSCDLMVLLPSGCAPQDAGAGLLAAAMIAVVPGYISRSVAGSYDNEGEFLYMWLC